MKLFIIKNLRKLILNFFTVLLFVGVLLSISIINPSSVSAQSKCNRIDQCVNNKKCICPLSPDNPVYEECFDLNNGLLVEGKEPCGSAIIGRVTAPGAVANINATSGGDIGVIFFISRLINFANIIAGILVMLNFVYAGFSYITSAGDSSAMVKINEKLTWSFIGIIIIVGSYTIAGIFGLVFYADPTFIIAPKLTGALQQ
jgi:hypothetical protein